MKNISKMYVCFYICFLKQIKIKIIMYEYLFCYTYRILIPLFDVISLFFFK